ncbi:DUF7344 domain-containing protein [Halorarum salinum]|uniref:DUF7344 domain-containing protein n=1 Tax=Halorarum salinum TaxID=2743089 RepID=A0A7D5QJF8_9EURY|nr:hypothetical protein [Halobaculum salinum]QLG63724.1 hypothetical protein HUG12_19135 [Halobaculum salinum]
MDVRQRTTTILRNLGHPYRQETITIVSDRSEPLTVDELAREIGTRTNAVGSDAHESDSVETISIELHHSHLPKLAAGDLIEYDSDANLVSSTQSTTHLRSLVEIAYSIAEVV